MIDLILKRIFWAFILIFITTFSCMALVHFSKGNVIFARFTQLVNNEMKMQIEENLNLNEPFLRQYFLWAKRFVKGDFSNSLVSGEKVSHILKETLPNTIILGFTSFFVLCFLSVFLAILSIMYKNTFLDKFLNIITMSFFAIPVFALSLILILFFSVYFFHFPSSGVVDLGFEDSLKNRIAHLILPSLALILSHLAIFLRFVRTALIESFNQNFVESAFARGLSKSRIYFHLVLKHAFSPIITYFSTSLISFIMNMYIVENVFSYGGIGNLVIQSIIFKDYPVVLAIAVLSIVGVVLINLCAEILCQIINPRSSYV